LPFFCLLCSCPLFRSPTPVTMHYEGKVKQRRAHASYNADGDAEMYRETTATLSKEVPQHELADHVAQVAVSFFTHSWIAHHQAMMFDKCIDGLPPDSICVLLDFSMNYSHAHPDASQQEWWSAHQTTLLPVIVYMTDADGQATWARCVPPCARAHKRSLFIELICRLLLFTTGHTSTCPQTSVTRTILYSMS
jgi:hypothetical protein